VNRVLGALAGWTAPTAEQELLRREFIAHAQAVTGPDHRDGRPDHVTASALVVSDDGGDVLLCLHRKVGLWLQFGGHVEPQDASLAAAALREAREEAGVTAIALQSETPIQLDRHAAPCSPTARYHLDVQFLSRVERGVEPIVSDESLDVRWFPVDDLPTKTDDAVRRLVTASKAARTAGHRSARPAR
jgi:8-oxo-dGTP pyrophosphatase MutT (NUDIX family)